MSGVTLSSFRPRLRVSVTLVGNPTLVLSLVPLRLSQGLRFPACSVIQPPMQPLICAKGAAASDGAFDS